MRKRSGVADANAAQIAPSRRGSALPNAETRHIHCGIPGAAEAVSCDVVTLLVRDAVPAEVGAACAVWFRAETARTGRHPVEGQRREFVESMTTALSKPGARLLVGLLRGEVTATIYGVPLKMDPTKAQVAMLAVDPVLWRTGIGTKMLQALMSALRAQGCRQLRMNVDPDNEPARTLYERHGWRHTGDTECVDTTDVPELIYRIDLGDLGAS